MLWIVRFGGFDEGPLCSNPLPLRVNEGVIYTKQFLSEQTELFFRLPNFFSKARSTERESLNVHPRFVDRFTPILEQHNREREREREREGEAILNERSRENVVVPNSQQATVPERKPFFEDIVPVASRWVRKQVESTS